MGGAEQLRVQPLQPGMVPRLPTVCDHCPLPRDEPPGTGQPWVDAAAETYGCCGVVAHLGATPVGHILVSPPVNVPVRGPYASAGVSPDAAVIMQFYVHPDHRGRRIGRRMLEELAGLLVRRRVAGIEVRASRIGPTCLAPPEDWLLEQGFRVLREDALCIRLRMDLRTTRSWWPSLASVEQGVRQLLGRPATGPEPAQSGTTSRLTP